MVVTGQGVVSSIGTGVESFWASMRRGTCGIGPIKNIALQDLYITIAGEVKDFDPRERCPSKSVDARGPLLAIRRRRGHRGDDAGRLQRPGENGDRAASIIGSGIGGLATLEKGYEDLFIHKKKATHPLTLLRTIGSSAAAHVSIEYGIKGPCFGTVSACSTAAHAIGLTYQMIRTA